MTPEFASGLATAITQAEQGDARLFAAIRAQALDDPVSAAAGQPIGGAGQPFGGAEGSAADS